MKNKGLIEARFNEAYQAKLVTAELKNQNKVMMDLFEKIYDANFEMKNELQTLNKTMKKIKEDNFEKTLALNRWENFRFELNSIFEQAFKEMENLEKETLKINNVIDENEKRLTEMNLVVRPDLSCFVRSGILDAGIDYDEKDLSKVFKLIVKNFDELRDELAEEKDHHSRFLDSPSRKIEGGFFKGFNEKDSNNKSKLSRSERRKIEFESPSSYSKGKNSQRKVSTQKVLAKNTKKSEFQIQEKGNETKNRSINEEMNSLADASRVMKGTTLMEFLDQHPLKDLRKVETVKADMLMKNIKELNLKEFQFKSRRSSKRVLKKTSEIGDNSSIELEEEENIMRVPNEDDVAPKEVNRSIGGQISVISFKESQAGPKKQVNEFLTQLNQPTIERLQAVKTMCNKIKSNLKDSIQLVCVFNSNTEEEENESKLD